LVLYAKRKKKRVVILELSSDIIANALNIYFLKKICNKADFITVRDWYTFTFLRYLTGRKDILKCADLSFLHVSNFSEDKKTTYVNTDITVGLNFLNYFGIYEEDLKNKFVLGEKLITELTQLMSLANLRLVYVSLQNDLGLQDKFSFDFLTSNGINIEFRNLNLHNCHDALLDIDLIITMRYHLAILSIMLGKPCLIIHHEMKLQSLVAEYGIPGISVYDFLENQNVLVDFLLTDFNRIKVQYHNLKKGRKKLLKEAEKNFEWLDKVITTLQHR